MEITLTADELLDVFKKNVRARRKELGLTQAQVAERCGIAQPNVAQFEAGVRVPAFDTLARLADALRTSPSVLLNPDAFSEVTA